MNKINIAIDGPCGAGKSTIAQEVARLLEYTFINTGSVYRALALDCINRKIDYKKEVEVTKKLEHGIIKMDKHQNIFLRNKDVTAHLRDDIVSKTASAIAQYPKVREYVVSFIQKMSKENKGYVMDGRDTTFKIMPHAELKIFLTADARERAKRRVEQNKELGYDTDFDTVYKEVLARDKNDMCREVDPLHKTEDSVEIECTHMNIQEVINKVLALAKERAK